MTMDAQLESIKNKVSSLFAEFNKELETCRAAMKDVSSELRTVKKEFDAYQSTTQAKLEELRSHRTLLGRQLLALRELQSNGGGITANEADIMATSSYQAMQGTIGAPAPDDSGTEPMSDVLKSFLGEIPAPVESYSVKPDSTCSSGDVSLSDEGAGSITTFDASSSNEKDMLSSNETSTSPESFNWSMESPQTIEPNNFDRRISVDSERTIPIDNSTQSNALRHSGTAPGMPRFNRASSIGSAVSNSGGKKEKLGRQRIFILRHAATCSAAEGKCKVTRHCPALQQVWKHIMDGCDDPKCGVRHCVSSRRVIRHFYGDKESFARVISSEKAVKGTKKHAQVKSSKSSRY